MKNLKISEFLCRHGASTRVTMLVVNSSCLIVCWFIFKYKIKSEHDVFTCSFGRDLIIILNPDIWTKSGRERKKNRSKTLFFWCLSVNVTMLQQAALTWSQVPFVMHAAFLWISISEADRKIFRDKRWYYI